MFDGERTTFEIAARDIYIGHTPLTMSIRQHQLSILMAGIQLPAKLKQLPTDHITPVKSAGPQTEPPIELNLQQLNLQ